MPPQQNTPTPPFNTPPVSPFVAPPPRRKKWPFIVGGVVLVLLSVGGFLILSQKVEPSVTTTEAQPAVQTKQTHLSAEEYRAQYYARFTYPKYEIATIQTYDGPYEGIVGIDAEGQKHELVPVKVLSKPAGSDWILYHSFRPGTDSGAWPYFAFNAKTGTLLVLKTISDYIDSAYPQKVRLSPDGKYYASVVSASRQSREEDARLFQTLYILDLVADTATPIKKLSGEESFVKDFMSWAGFPRADVRWIDDHTLEYSVFDTSRKIDPEDPDGPSGETQHPLLRTEMISIET